MNIIEAKQRGIKVRPVDGEDNVSWGGYIQWSAPKGGWIDEDGTFYYTGGDWLDWDWEEYREPLKDTSAQVHEQLNRVLEYDHMSLMLREIIKLFELIRERHKEM